MSNRKHLGELRKGTEDWNLWRAQHRKIVPDLRFADLSRRNLPEVDLSAAELYGADLSGINFDSANLRGANFTEANLTDANLRFADLSHANFSGANLRGTTFSNATVGWTIFSDVDLSQARHLGTVTHYGPSSIGVETLYRSGGKIPGDFLRGCGLPENFVAHIPTYINAESVIQFYSCFISYSGEDKHFADLLCSRLCEEDIRVWFAPADMNPGRKIEEQIDQAIRLHDKLLLVLSEHSLNSEWVKTEIRKASQAASEKEEGRHKLFPIRLVDMETLRNWKCFDADIGRDLGVELREYFIPDFSRWDDRDFFEQAFSRLLKALNKPRKSVSA